MCSPLSRLVMWLAYARFFCSLCSLFCSLCSLFARCACNHFGRLNDPQQNMSFCRYIPIAKCFGRRSASQVVSHIWCAKMRAPASHKKSERSEPHRERQRATLSAPARHIKGEARHIHLPSLPPLIKGSIISAIRPSRMLAPIWMVKKMMLAKEKASGPLMP